MNVKIFDLKSECVTADFVVVVI